MKKSLLLCVVLWSLRWWPTLVQGQPNTQNVIRTDPTSVDVEYDGVVICFRCDVTPSPENRARCQQEGHQPLLRRSEGHTHTLVGSTNKLTAQLASDGLHGKAVHVKGIYYPKTNYILVSEVTLRAR
jgi:hypothetical protein